MDLQRRPRWLARGATQRLRNAWWPIGTGGERVVGGAAEWTATGDRGPWHG
jgi:hypothetical protein